MQIKDNKLSENHQSPNFAATANYHPYIAISYNQVTINLTTHDVGGLTLLDFDLATTISQLIKTWKSDKKCKY